MPMGASPPMFGLGVRIGYELRSACRRVGYTRRNLEAEIRATSARPVAPKRLEAIGERALLLCLVAKDKAEVHVSQERVQNFEEAFNKIRT